MPTYEEAIAEISSLDAPSETEDQVASFIAEMQRGLDKASEQPLQFLRGSRPFGNAPQIAREIGLVECAETMGG